MSSLCGMVDITCNATGQKVSVPSYIIGDVSIVQDFAYWRAYFFRLGLGLSVESAKNAVVQEWFRAAKLEDYSVTIMNGGKVIWSSKDEKGEEVCEASGVQGSAG